MKPVTFFILFFLCQSFVPASAQFTISGKVSAEGKALAGVRADIRPENSNQILAFSFSDENGSYRLLTAHEGPLILIFRSLGYESVSVRIAAPRQDTTLDVQLVAGGMVQLREVIVHPKKAYRQNNDTIELNVRSFLQGDERKVEDLLRKIPGIQVGEDGSIKIGNIEVEKVMVEGDDFFEKGYRLLTQNMSVEPLEKIQVLKRYSNNKHLKGIEHSDKVALNLQLKTASKNRWIGSLAAHGAPIGPKYYLLNASLMSFGKKNKYYALGTANNNGVDAVSGINHLLSTGSPDEPGQVGEGISAPVLIDNTPALPGFDYRRTNFNQDKLLSFNTILNPSKRLKIKWMGFANPVKKTFYRNAVQEYQLQDVHFTNTEQFRFDRKLDNYFSRLELHVDLGDRSTLVYKGSLGMLRKSELGRLRLNETESNEHTRNNGYVTNHLLTFTHKLSDRKAIVSSVRWIAQASPLHYSIDQYYYEDLFGEKNMQAVQQRIENDLRYLGATSHYISKKRNGNYFELSVTGTFQRQRLATDLSLHTDGSGRKDTTIHPPGFANDMQLSIYQTTILTSYTIKRKRWELTPRLQAGFVQAGMTKSGEFTNRGNGLLSPGLSGKWQPYRKGKLEADLSFRQRNTTLTELIPHYYSTGIRNFTHGLNGMATLSQSAGTLTFTHGSMVDRFFAEAAVGHNILFDYISSASYMHPNFNLNSQVLLKGKRITQYRLGLNYYAGAFTGNIKLDLGAHTSSYQTLYAGMEPRNVRTEAYEAGLSFRSVWKSKLNIYAGYKLQSSHFRTETASTLENGQGFLHILLNIHKNLHCNLKNEVYRFGGFLEQSARNYYFSDFVLHYNLVKSGWQFNLTARNIFDNRQFRSATQTETFRSVTEYRLLPAYVTLGVELNF